MCSNYVCKGVLCAHTVSVRECSVLTLFGKGVLCAETVCYGVLCAQTVCKGVLCAHTVSVREDSVLKQCV